MTHLLAVSETYRWFLDLELWAVVVFIALATIVLRFGAAPVISGLRGRQKAIEDQLRELQEAEAEIAAIRADHEKQRQKMRSEALEMVAEARRDAVALRTEMVDRAKDEVEKLKNRSTRDIELARRKAVSDLADFATETSFRVARERLERGVSADDHDRLVAAALAEMDGRSS